MKVFVNILKVVLDMGTTPVKIIQLRFNIVARWKRPFQYLKNANFKIATKSSGLSVIQFYLRFGPVQYSERL